MSKIRLKKPTTVVLEAEVHPLLSAVKLLSNLGDAGRYVWLHSKTMHNQQAKFSYLDYAIKHLKARILEHGGARYRELPVDIVTFVESALLLGMGDEVYPTIKQELSSICSGRYMETVFTGGIGSGKTTGALITTAYSLYELSCLQNPQAVFGLARSSEIVLIFQSLNKDRAKEVDFERFKAMVDNSPYFKVTFPYDHSLKSMLRFPSRIVVKPLSGDDKSAIGENIFGGVIDEVNFMSVIENSKSSLDGGTYDQARMIYASIARRRESRFMSEGRLPGMLCLVSSKRYPGEFTDRKIEEAKTNPNIYIYDKRVWEVKDGMGTGGWFWVFTGSVSKRPRILTDEEKEALESEEELLVRRIPVEYLHAFRDNMLDALRDIAGVSTLAMHPFVLEPERITACFGLVPSILSRPECDFEVTKVGIYPKRIQRPHAPRFCHVDLAVTGDSCGFTVGHVSEFVAVTRGDRVEMLPVVVFDLILEIRPPVNGEIQFENVRKLIYKLKDVGCPIKWVSFDSYQSRDSIQLLAQQGFQTGMVSMDTSSTPYDVGRLAFYDGRVLCPEHEKALTEWVRLEKDPATGKIDHPPNWSKDCSDSMAGVIYGLTMRREIWSLHNISVSSIPDYLTNQARQHTLDKEREERAKLLG